MIYIDEKEHSLYKNVKELKAYEELYKQCRTIEFVIHNHSINDNTSVLKRLENHANTLNDSKNKLSDKLNKLQEDIKKNSEEYKKIIKQVETINDDKMILK